MWMESLSLFAIRDGGSDFQHEQQGRDSLELNTNRGEVES